jgi:hypothetical protein
VPINQVHRGGAGSAIPYRFNRYNEAGQKRIDDNPLVSSHGHVVDWKTRGVGRQAGVFPKGKQKKDEFYPAPSECVRSFVLRGNAPVVNGEGYQCFCCLTGPPDGGIVFSIIIMREGGSPRPRESRVHAARAGEQCHHLLSFGALAI